MTARRTLPSTSWKTAATSAVRPARNMSWASAPRPRGRSRTRPPRPRGTPSTSTVSVAGDRSSSAPSCHQAGRAPAGGVPAGVCGVSAGVCGVSARAGRVAGASERTAPCSRSKISRGMVSTRSRIAAARASVARASRFSSSVSSIVRSVRISSISAASCRSPGLSGATWGWSGRMIGADSRIRASSSSPPRTGKVNSFRHERASVRRSAGGSISETNSTPSPPMRVWVAMRARRMASSRAVRGCGAGPLFVVRTRSRHRSSVSRSAVMVVSALTSSRRRTIRPAPSGSGSVSTPAAAPTGTVRPPRRSSSRGTSASCSRGTASSKLRCVVPSPVLSDSTAWCRPSGPVSSTCLRCIWRYRTRTRTDASPRRRIRSRHSVCWYQESAEPDTPGATGPSDSTQSRGNSTPNCHRTRFLAEERR